MRIFAYLRASTDKQDAQRARKSLKDLVVSHGKQISHYYVENMSGAKLERPELNELIDECERGDLLLIESMDRLTRLSNDDWDILNGRLKANGIKLVVLDLPTTHRRLDDKYTDDPSLNLIDTLLFELWASGARADYEKRRLRQRQGIDNLKNNKPDEYAQKYKGKQPNYQNYINILEFRKVGKSYSEIEKLLNITRATISKAIKWGNDVTENGKKPLPTWNAKTKELVFDKKTK